jgi:hypothetical protein
MDKSGPAEGDESGDEPYDEPYSEEQWEENEVPIDDALGLTLDPTREDSAPILEENSARES